MPKPIIANARQVRKLLAGPSMGRYIDALGATDMERDAEIEKLVRDAQSEFESECKISLFHTRIKTAPVREGLARRTSTEVGDYDRTEDAHPYFMGDFFAGPVSLKLRKRPVLSIEGFYLRWGPNPNEGRLMDFPKGWLSPEQRGGWLHIAALIGGGAATLQGTIIMLPIAGAVMRSSAVPMLLGVDYTAGFLPYTFNPAADDLDDACPDFDNIRAVAHGIKAHAALNVLKNTRLAKGAAGGSIGIDGISASYTAGKFAQEIADLEASVEKAKSKLTEFMGGWDFFLG